MLKKLGTTIALTDKKRQRLEHLRRLINDNHPMRDEFRRQLQEKLNKDKDKENGHN